MGTAKRVAVTIVAVAAAAAVGIGVFTLYKKTGGSKKKGEVYVTKVSELNTASGLSLSGSRFSGVIETQKTDDYKYDTSKKVDKILVKEGDSVKPGDVLFSYDVEAMQLQLDQGKIDVERMENEIEMNKSEIEELKKEKAAASEDGQISLNTQILSLQSDNAKTEYDIKAKKAENKKLKNSIKNSQVYCDTEGTVKTIAELDKLEMSESNVVVSVSKGENLLIKGTVNEQMIQNIYVEMPVILRSRVDENTTWSGWISEIDTSPQNNNDNMYYDDYGDSSASSSKYTFYVETESTEGLMLGQHIIIEPDTTDGGASIEKKGIWLPSDFIFKDGGKTYVWAKGSKNKIEKREVSVGQKDEEAGDCEILSGLKKTDSIAYPDDNIKEGMKISDEKKQQDIPEENYNENPEGENFGGEDFGGDFGDGDFGGEDFGGDYDYEDFGGDEDFDFEDYETDGGMDFEVEEDFKAEAALG